MDTKKTTQKNKNLKYYLKLPWSYTVTTTSEGGGKTLFIVRVNELPGVVTDAPTIQEAMNLIKEAMKGAFELYRENGEVIPEPVDPETYKGRIAYRTTSKRHARLAQEALVKRVSLSTVIDECIDRQLK